MDSLLLLQVAFLTPDKPDNKQFEEIIKFARNFMLKNNKTGDIIVQSVGPPIPRSKRGQQSQMLILCSKGRVKCYIR